MPFKRAELSINHFMDVLPFYPKILSNFRLNSDQVRKIRFALNSKFGDLLIGDFRGLLRYPTLSLSIVLGYLISPSKSHRSPYL